MIPLRFGPAGRQLFGCYHAPTATAPRRTAIVIAPPFAQEAMRAQRMLRLLAERLSRGGFPVLRFDFYGTGDSDGDCAAGSGAQWESDLVAADIEARTRGGATQTAWIGLGLGASLAAHASRHLSSPLASLVLWDPVVDDAKYLAELRALHRHHVPQPLPPDFRPRNVAAPDGESIVDEILGFPLTRPILDAIAAAARPLRTPARARRVVALTSSQPPLDAAVARKWAGGVPATDVRTINAWSTADFDDIIASGVVYNDVVKAVADAVAELP
jgi:pimeloyl-ACP methyl ester carboxylesterase